MKKKGYKGLTNAWGQKPWRILRKKMTKKSYIGSVEEEYRKGLKSFWNFEEHVREKAF